MSAYADWTFYTATYLGNAITQANFPRLALRASEVLDMLSFDRVAPIIEADEDDELTIKIQFATCALAEEIQRQENLPGGISSERVGGHSISYALTSEMQMSNHAKLSKAVKVHLGSTGLLYSGFAEGEYGSS